MIVSLLLTTLLMTYSFAAGETYVDVKPGSCPNAVNFNNRGVLPVALLGGNGAFDIDAVDPATILFGPAGERLVVPIRWNLEDVNGDGEMDLVMHFSIPALQALFADVIAGDADGYVAAGIQFEAGGVPFVYEGDDDVAGLWLKIPGFQ